MKKNISKSLRPIEQKPVDDIELTQLNESTDIYSKILKMTAFSPQKLPTLPPLDLKVYSPDWINYRQQMLKVSDLHKQLLCLIFLSTLIMCMQDKTLALSDHEHAEQFSQVSLLFWYAINNTNISFTDIGVLLQIIQGEDFNKVSYLQKQIFFLTNATHIVTRYTTLLSSLDKAKEKPIKPETLLLKTISPLYTASFEVEAFMLAVKNVITDFEIEVTAANKALSKKDAIVIRKIHEGFSKGITSYKILRDNINNILRNVYGSWKIYCNTLASRIKTIKYPIFTPEALNLKDKDTDRLPTLSISELQLPVETTSASIQITEDKKTVTLPDSKLDELSSSSPIESIQSEQKTTLDDIYIDGNSLVGKILLNPLRLFAIYFDTGMMQSFQQEMIKGYNKLIVIGCFLEEVLQCMKKGKLNLSKAKREIRFQQIMLLFSLAIKTTPLAETECDKYFKFFQHSAFLKKPAHVQRGYFIQKTGPILEQLPQEDLYDGTDTLVR